MKVVAKVLLALLGTLGALYAIVAVIQFVRVLFAANAANPYGTAQIAASVVPICLGLIVCVACFSAALKRPKK